jgi:hypothetical protein
MHASSIIESACCPRLGAPPLRFKGWCLARHARVLPDGEDLFIELWKRQRGGFTAAFSQWHDGQWRCDALTAGTLDDVITGVEMECAPLLGTYCNVDPTVPEQFLQAALATQNIADFLRLVGHALDDWDALKHADAQTALRVAHG